MLADLLFVRSQRAPIEQDKQSELPDVFANDLPERQEYYMAKGNKMSDVERHCCTQPEHCPSVFPSDR